MTDISTYQGKVTEHQEPKGKGPHKFTISQGDVNGYEKNKRFRVWATDYKTKEPNPALDKLLFAARGAAADVVVEFYTKQGEYQGKTFPENYITAVEFVGGGDSSPARSVSEPPALSTPTTNRGKLALGILEASLQDALAAIQELKGAADAAPADDGW